MRANLLLIAVSLLTVPLLGCIAPDGGAGLGDGQPITLPLTTIDQGQESGVTDQRTVLVTDQAAWEQLWSEHAEPRGDTQAPAVDFQNASVIAAFHGQGPDACRSIEITGATYDAANATAHVEVAKITRTGVMCAEVLTHPFHIATIPVTAEAATFNVTELERPADQDDGDAGEGGDDPVQNGTGDQDGSPAQLIYETLAQGSQSGIQDERHLVVRDNASWQALWENHTSTQQPPPERPSVDFEQRMVVAVFIGEQPNGCHHANITRISRAENGTVTVHAEQTLQDGFCTQQITHPFHIVETAKEDGPVSFQVENVNQQA